MLERIIFQRKKSKAAEQTKRLNGIERHAKNENINFHALKLRRRLFHYININCAT